jgi:hypothetical protein
MTKVITHSAPATRRKKENAMSANAEIAKKLAADIHPTEAGSEGEFSLRDIAITAVEGGINYWGFIEGYDPDAVDHWGRVTENESSTDGPAMSGELTVATMRRGLALAIENRLDAGWSIPRVTAFYLTNVDASAAELVVQFAVLGEHVYA